MLKTIGRRSVLEYHEIVQTEKVSRTRHHLLYMRFPNQYPFPQVHEIFEVLELLVHIYYYVVLMRVNGQNCPLYIMIKSL